MRSILLILIIFITGCMSSFVRPKLDSSINYQRDIRFDVQSLEGNKWSKKMKFNGVGVVKMSSRYKIKVFPPGKVDMITITSCHREEKTPNPKSSGWFSSGYEFELKPVKGLESGRACSFSIGLYEKKKGRHGWGLLAIDTGREKMPAVTQCNGIVRKTNGVSICQSKQGLIQKYIFESPVEVAHTSVCAIRKPEDRMNWEFLMPSGECVVYFIDKENPDNIHQAILFGYDTIPIRGVE